MVYPKGALQALFFCSGSTQILRSFLPVFSCDTQSLNKDGENRTGKNLSGKILAHFRKKTKICPAPFSSFVIILVIYSSIVKLMIMQDFMLIFRGGSDASGLSPDEMQNHMQKWFQWVDELKAKNIYVGGKQFFFITHYTLHKCCSGSSGCIPGRGSN